MQRKWKLGDVVTVVTVNRGLREWQPEKGLKRQVATETWTGEIVGPSVLGPGWWNIQRLAPTKGVARRGVYAVPEGEIRPRKR